MEWEGGSCVEPGTPRYSRSLAKLSPRPVRLSRNSLWIGQGRVQLAFACLVEDDLSLPADLKSCTADGDFYGLSLPSVSLCEASMLAGVEGRQTHTFMGKRAARQESFQEG